MSTQRKLLDASALMINAYREELSLRDNLPEPTEGDLEVFMNEQFFQDPDTGAKLLWKDLHPWMRELILQFVRAYITAT